MNTLKERLTWARAQKTERDQHEFTQQDLADKAGVSQGSIGHLESGRTKTSRRLTAIAHALGVDPVWLAEGKGSPFLTADEGAGQKSDEMELKCETADEMRMLIAYRLANKPGRMAFNAVANTVYSLIEADRKKQA